MGSVSTETGCWIYIMSHTHSRIVHVAPLSYIVILPVIVMDCPSHNLNYLCYLGLVAIEHDVVETRCETSCA